MLVKGITDVDRCVAKRLLLARQAAGLSQGRAAKDLDVSQQQLQKYETGVNRISCGRLAELASLYGVTLAWMVRDVTSNRGIPAENKLPGAAAPAIRLMHHIVTVDDAAGCSR